MQVPEGPAHKHLEPGDVLVRINEEVRTAFNGYIYLKTTILSAEYLTLY